jgi:hypothetical protein
MPDHGKGRMNRFPTLPAGKIKKKEQLIPIQAPFILRPID